MRGRICPVCRRRTVIYVHGLRLSYCTNKGCHFVAKNDTFEKHCEEFLERALDTRNSWEKIPGLTGLISKRAELTEETLAIGLHTIAIEERIEQEHLERHQAPCFDEIPEESRDVYRVIARFIIKFFVAKE